MIIYPGNIVYFAILGLAAIFVLVMVYISTKLDKKVVYWLIFGLLIANFALHFLKQLLPDYLSDFPYSLRKSSFENICAVSVMIFPWIYLWGNKTLKDYMYYMGVLSGILACLMPSDAMGRTLDNFNAISELLRYYICHIGLIVAPLMMVFSGLHKLDYRRIWKQPLVFFSVLLLIFINEIALKLCGLLSCSWEEFFSRSFRNAAFIFGPPGFADQYFGWCYGFAILPIFKYFVNGQEYFVPILWLIIPAYVLILPIDVLMSLPFEGRHIKLDALKFLKQRQLARESAQYE